MLLTPQQFNDPRYGSPTDKQYLALLENSHITCRGNIISNNNNNTNDVTSSAPSTPNSAAVAVQSSSTTANININSNNNNNSEIDKNKKKISPNKKYDNESLSDSESEEESDVDDEEDLSDNESYCRFQQKFIQQQDDNDDLSLTSEEEDDGEDETETETETEEILSDDESTDKSSSESSDDDSESESETEDDLIIAADDSEKEIYKRKEWANVSSDLSLKKSVSSIFFKASTNASDDSSEEEEEEEEEEEDDDDFDSSSDDQENSSASDIDYSVFGDQFLPSYSIRVSPPKKKERYNTTASSSSDDEDYGLGRKPIIGVNLNRKGSASCGDLLSIVSSSDDELYNTNRYCDDSEEELRREAIKKEQENDKIVLRCIRKSINGTTGDSDSTTSVKPPCWYGFEDESHIKVIFQQYSSFLQIDQEAKHTKRGPKPFVGRIHRRAIKYEGGEPGCKFTTLDTIKVYRWEIQPIGRPLNLYKSFVLLTRWDEENGLPVKLQKVNSLSNKDFWANEAKYLKAPGNSISSYLYCSPIFDTDFTFNFSIDSEKYPVDFLPNSPIMLGGASSRRNNNQHHYHDSVIESNLHYLQNHQQQQPKKLDSSNRNGKLSDSQLLSPNSKHIKPSLLSVTGGIVHQRRSSHPSLLLSSHIYSHSIIPQNGFKDKSSSTDYS